MDLWTLLTQPLFERKIERQLKEPVIDRLPLSPTLPKPKERKPTALVLPPPDTPTTLPTIADFLKAEIHLETMGFFTPVKNRATIKRTSKTITLKGQHQGKPVEASVRILPSAEYGFPITADLDKYRAFQKILTDHLKEYGHIPQHITFTSAQLIRLMGKERRHGGELYKEIIEWLRRMQLTGITSEAAIYHSGQKEFIRDTVTVFNRAVQYGKELDDGTIADRHHVWLSDWYWANVNAFKTEPLDYNLHKALSKPISKALLPILKEGFYAGEGIFNKRYDDLCTLLGITTHQALFYIHQQLDPAHLELQKTGFLKSWVYTKSNDNGTYVITWKAGVRYHRELEAQRKEQQRLSQRAEQPIRPSLASPHFQPLIDQLTTAGIGQAAAQDIASRVDPQTIERWLFIKPYLRAKDPAAYIAHALTKGIPVPEYAQRALQKARQQEAQQKLEQTQAEQVQAQQRQAEQRHQELLTYYATFSPTEQAAIDQQALQQIGPASRALAHSYTTQDKNPLDSPIVRADFNEQRYQLLEHHRATQQASVKPAA